MKIALYGATGMIGRRILDEALQRGHEVTAIVRDESKVAEESPNLHVVTGDILAPQDVAEKVAGHDAVLPGVREPSAAAPRSVAATAAKAPRSRRSSGDLARRSRRGGSRLPVEWLH